MNRGDARARILTVEDSNTQSMVLVHVLEAGGYSVTTVSNGLAAIEYLATAIPDLVITDVTMPGMDGYSLCRAIRGDDRLAAVPVLLLTGLDDESEVIKGLEAGADAFIGKPYDETRLLARVRSLIDGGREKEGNDADTKILFSGKEYHISSDRPRILRYLISTYDNALQQNAQRAASEAMLQVMNSTLEEKVRARTVDLSAEVEQRKTAQRTVEDTKDEARQAGDAREYAESIIDTIREPLIALDQDLRVVSVSRSFYDVFKAKPEETIGQLIYDLGNKQWDIPKLRELLENILPARAAFDNYEVEHDFATIGRRFMLLNARQIGRVAGKERIILLAIEDITARREIEDAHGRLAAIVESAEDAIIVEDMEGTILSWNGGAETTYGYKAREIVGSSISTIMPLGSPDLYKAIIAKIGRGEGIKHYESQRRTKDGRLIDVSLTLSPVRDSSGKITSASSIARDITERKEIENGLEKAHEDLKVLTAELKRVALVKSEFLANMSHELRTPLNSINGFSEVLFDETFGPLNAKQKTYVMNVLTSGKHLLLLINQILDMAKVEAGKMKLSLSILPMSRILDEISLLTADMAVKKNLKSFLEIEDGLPAIEADELKIKEVIYNLLSNAIKFTPSGGSMGMRARKTADGLEVEVWDTGVGIAEENMSKIFEGFFRVDTPYSRLTEGTGLGLPLAKKMVELHGGTFVVESDGLDKGTKVVFSLPSTQIKRGVT